MYVLRSQFKICFVSLPGLSLERKRLKPDAVPSVFSWKRKLDTQKMYERSARLQKRKKVLPTTSSPITSINPPSIYDNIISCDDNPDSTDNNKLVSDESHHIFSPSEIACEVEVVVLDDTVVVDQVTSDKTCVDGLEKALYKKDIPMRDGNLSTPRTRTNQPTNQVISDLPSDRASEKIAKMKGPPKSAGTQTVFRNGFSICRIMDKPERIAYYTGLESYEKFLFVYRTLGPAVDQLTYRDHQVNCVSPEDQFLMTLMKLRLGSPDFELGDKFDVGHRTVGNIIVTWIRFMYLEWSELNIWPSKELIKFYMPEGFKKEYPSTRLIIDGTEIPIEKPSNPIAQQATWSNYKNRNTLKILVGTSPGGLISYVSPAFGGSTSDRAVVERSKLVEMCNDHDSVMADRGFTVQDLFARKNVTVNIPSFLKGKSQLPGLTVIKDRKLANKRVHIERAIGLTKTYKICKRELNGYYVNLGSEIYFLCAMLCNFRECIVGKKA